MENRTYDVKPIPTVYKGISFKSRLEARWAVFFDALAIKWFYEYEGYQLPSGWYVPDFWLPEFRMWVEIKPNEPTSQEVKLVIDLAAHTDNPVAIHFGDILEPDEWCRNSDSAHIYWAEGMDIGHLWCVCPKCGAIGFEFDGRGARVCSSRCFPHDDKLYTGRHPRLIYAYLTAQQYQFR